ncbi:N-alpha-acetyl-L-2,4-diaminobutyric acid deacetylase [Pontiella desulfatans]|uniref:N-alpha-acetyl-L-2,4-diaminobutyric acid deacetylase n=1 Tax=Pontiella desulfatans TaxID=2750659 RepID=A0A6C2U9J0_PONDE|nr:succinylglutamate desuccinylase/aspartoacylase family protein [Pontiella desulfatans]VGO16772.1 N-alpha-acetyl-L-2,4-diaminobutyric acid deacetylase [Pontiella desulfatans]
MQAAITIDGQEIKAGTRQSIHLPLPEFYNYSPTTMTIHVVHGRNPGPCLLVTSAVHGDEINGVEIIRRLLGHKSIERIKGTLLLIPVVNVFGFVAQSRYLPDRRDLNRSFPGSPKGSMASRLANVLMTEVLPHCTHVIDLHTGAVARENFPQIRATLNGNAELAALAKAFNAPVVLDAGLRDGTFRKAAHELGIPSLVYEAGEALRFDEVSIRAGVAGILNILSHLGMVRKRMRRKEHHPLIAKSSSWVRASQSGVARSLVPLGAKVSVGDELAYISDPSGGHEELVKSSVAGIVIGRTRLPLVHEGEAIFHIARFSQTSEAAESIENFQDAFDPLTDTVESEEPPVFS